MERQTTDLEKIFVTHTSNKGFVSQQIKKNSSNSLLIMTKSQFMKMFSRYFIKEDIQMASEHMRRGWALLDTREMHIQTIMRYHVIGRVWIKLDNTKCDIAVEQLEHSYIAVCNVKWHSHCRKQFGSLLIN